MHIFNDKSQISLFARLMQLFALYVMRLSIFKERPGNIFRNEKLLSETYRSSLKQETYFQINSAQQVKTFVPNAQWSAPKHSILFSRTCRDPFQIWLKNNLFA